MKNNKMFLQQAIDSGFRFFKVKTKSGISRLEFKDFSGDKILVKNHATGNIVRLKKQYIVQPLN